VTADPIVVLDYGIGNLRSAEKALRHLGVAAELVTEPDQVAKASGVILPGVGAFGACADALERSGLGEAAKQAVKARVPFLGICVGLQLLYEFSDESPGARGLGILPGTVHRMTGAVKLPQMQWNQLDRRRGSPCDLLDGLPERPWVYFVHSFAPDVDGRTVATCDYGGAVTAVVEQDRVWGVQFHPEKSGSAGLAILANFVRICQVRAQPAGC